MYGTVLCKYIGGNDRDGKELMKLKDNAGTRTNGKDLPGINLDWKSKGSISPSEE